MAMARLRLRIAACAAFAGAAGLAGAQQGNADADAAELAKKLQNPVASLVSVPIQNNWDTGIGEADAKRYTLNVQPVIPVEVNPKWNVIIRTIMPYIDAESPAAGASQSMRGLGDIVQSFFFSPKAPTDAGWIWGVGPALLYPTASNDALGSEKWGIGPTAVVLKQEHGWTYGVLGNHIWSFAGNSDRRSVNATFAQPFISFTTKTFTSFGLNTESTYDWTGRTWTVPINVSVTQLLKLGGQPMSFSLGLRGYAHGPDAVPDWGVRFVFTLLFPK
jgi:hypothetical protein